MKHPFKQGELLFWTLMMLFGSCMELIAAANNTEERFYKEMIDSFNTAPRNWL